MVTSRKDRQSSIVSRGSAFETTTGGASSENNRRGVAGSTDKVLRPNLGGVSLSSSLKRPLHSTGQRGGGREGGGGASSPWRGGYEVHKGRRGCAGSLRGERGCPHSHKCSAPHQEAEHHSRAFESGTRRRRRRRRRGEALLRRFGRSWKNPTRSGRLRAALCASSHAREAPSVELRRLETLRSAARNAKRSEAVCRSVSRQPGSGRRQRSQRRAAYE